MRHIELSRNIPRSKNWIGSFYEQLAEHGIFDYDAFWKLHRDLILLAKDAKERKHVNSKLAYELLKVQQDVLRLFCSHFDKNDIFKIKGMNSEKIREFKEIFEIAVIGAISGQVLPDTSFNYLNPLLKKA
jgi:hypothetical protein